MHKLNAYHFRPFKDWVYICRLDETKRANIERMYWNDRQCKTFVDAITAVERRSLEAEIQDAKFISFMSDGSVDVAAIENEIT